MRLLGKEKMIGANPIEGSMLPTHRQRWTGFVIRRGGRKSLRKLHFVSIQGSLIRRRPDRDRRLIVAELQNGCLPGGSWAAYGVLPVWCNSSTSDFDSLCQGANPCAGAIFEHRTVRGRDIHRPEEARTPKQPEGEKQLSPRFSQTDQ